MVTGQIRPLQHSKPYCCGPRKTSWNSVCNVAFYFSALSLLIRFLVFFENFNFLSTESSVYFSWYLRSLESYTTAVVNVVGNEHCPHETPQDVLKWIHGFETSQFRSSICFLDISHVCLVIPTFKLVSMTWTLSNSWIANIKRHAQN